MPNALMHVTIRDNGDVSMNVIERFPSGVVDGRPDQFMVFYGDQVMVNVMVTHDDTGQCGITMVNYSADGKLTKTPTTARKFTSYQKALTTVLTYGPAVWDYTPVRPVRL